MRKQRESSARHWRDWYASTPWGAALFLPGAALVVIGVGMNPAGAGWEKPIIWAGLASFGYLVACIQTRLKARALQREIDSLQALRPTQSSSTE